MVHALLNKKGVTLIEMMIALTILLIVSLALMQTALLGIRENLRNTIRDEAVNLVDRRMNELRSMPTDTLTLGSHVESDITVTFRAGTVKFTPTVTVAQVGSDTTTKEITAAVSWVYLNKTYTQSISSIMGK